MAGDSDGCNELFILLTAPSQHTNKWLTRTGYDTAITTMSEKNGQTGSHSCAVQYEQHSTYRHTMAGTLAPDLYLATSPSSTSEIERGTMMSLGYVEHNLWSK